MLVALGLMAGGVSDRLPEDVATWGGEILEQIRENPGLQRLLLIIGVATAAVFIFGIVKQALKAGVIGGVLCVAAWFLYFTVN